MKTKLFNFIIIGTLLVTGVVSAQTEDFATPVHTGGYEQKKEGSFVASFLKAGLKVLPVNIPSLVGFVIADKVISSPQGFFNTVILPVNNKGNKAIEPKLLVGAISNLNEVLENRAPVTVKLAGRGEDDISRGRDAVALLADPTICTPNVSVISTNTSAFLFRSDTNLNSGNSSDKADIIARQIQLSGGSPGAGKVLISIDSQGTATWATVRVNNNGEAEYEHSKSPVYNGLCESEPSEPVDICLNIPGTQTVVPSGYANVDWVNEGSICKPYSCNTDLIGTQLLGETITKSSDCPIQRKWDRTWTYPIGKTVFGTDEHRINPNISLYIGKAMDNAYFKNTQYDVSNGAQRFRVGVLEAGKHSIYPTSRTPEQYNTALSQVSISDFNSGILDPQPTPDRYVEKSFLYKSVYTTPALTITDCKIVPTGIDPSKNDKWSEDPRVIAIGQTSGPLNSNKNTKVWVPAYSCVKTMSSVLNVPSNLKIQEAYQLEYFYPIQADVLRYAKSLD